MLAEIIYNFEKTKMIKKTLSFIRIISFNLLPVFTILLSILLAIAPYKISNSSLLMPLIMYITIYFWTIYRPSMVPHVAMLTLGILKDAIESNILGYSALSFLLFQLIIKSQRKYIYNNIFIVVWAEFMFCLSLILLLPLLLSEITTKITHYPLSIIFIQWLITIFAYVPLHWILNKLNNLRPHN